MKRLLQTQESVNPYQSIAAAQTDSTASTYTGISRGLWCQADATDVAVTFADGTSATMSFTAKNYYPLAIKEVDDAAGLFFLY